VFGIGLVHRGRQSRPGPPAVPAPKSEATRYAAAPAALAAEYRQWLEQHEPDPDGLAALGRSSANWRQRPLVSVILSVDADIEPGWLEQSIDSVVAQVYDHWELWIVDDRSPSGSAPAIELMATDARIRPIADRLATEQAQGEWVVRLEPGDQLRPDALHRIIAHVEDHPDDDVVYADEDRLSPGNQREQPEFKPDWSPDYLLSRDYLGCPTAVRRGLFDRVGGWHIGFGSEGRHDLHLRVTERARGVGHVTSVLATRRGRGTPTDAESTESDNPVAQALTRRRQAGRAVPRIDGRNDLNYEVRYQIDGRPSVDIVIPTRDRVDLLEACIDSIITLSTYPSYQITVVDNDSVQDATLRFFERDDLRIVRSPGAFNFSRLVNAGARASNADYVLLLNNDVTVLTPDWIEAMLEIGQQPHVGAVGCRLLFPDGSVQHEGVALIREYVAANVSWPWPVIRNTSAVTAACMLVRRDMYWSIGGFDERMGVVYNDVDFCLRMVRSGQRVVYTPYAELVHDESSSRGKVNPQADIDLFFSRWGPSGRLHDPYVSPHVLWPNPQRLRMTGDRAGVR
jgi:GT2 family glycosyltransferase